MLRTQAVLTEGDLPCSGRNKERNKHKEDELRHVVLVLPRGVRPAHPAPRRPPTRTAGRGGGQLARRPTPRGSANRGIYECLRDEGRGAGAATGVAAAGAWRPLAPRARDVPGLHSGVCCVAPGGEGSCGGNAPHHRRCFLNSMNNCTEARQHAGYPWAWLLRRRRRHSPRPTGPDDRGEARQ